MSCSYSDNNSPQIVYMYTDAKREHVITYLIDGREADAPHCLAVTATDAEQSERVGAPHLDRLVLRAARHEPVVGRHRHRVDVLVVTALRRQHLQLHLGSSGKVICGCCCCCGVTRQSPEFQGQVVAAADEEGAGDEAREGETAE